MARDRSITDAMIDGGLDVPVEDAGVPVHGNRHTHSAGRGDGWRAGFSRNRRHEDLDDAQPVPPEHGADGHEHTEGHAAHGLQRLANFFDSAFGGHAGFERDSDSDGIFNPANREMPLNSHFGLSRSRHFRDAEDSELDHGHGHRRGHNRDRGHDEHGNGHGHGHDRHDHDDNDQDTGGDQNTDTDWGDGGTPAPQPSNVPTESDDVLTGTAGDDTIDGLGGNDTIDGLDGNDTLIGGAGDDTMSGGLGDDTYHVDSIGDVVIEDAGAGTDTVVSSVGTTLGANVENLTLTGADNLSGAGNGLDNVIQGNAGANTLSGGAGSDRLDGGAGADTMAGGTGDDTYVVDNAGDVVTENAGEGVDTVESGISYALGADVENLTLTGTNNLSGTGNGLDNAITGNDGANMIDGGAGADVMSGALGDDTYVVDNAGDSVIETAGGGTDTVLASVSYTLGANVENLTLTGAGDLAGAGNGLDNVITGNGGANSLAGGAGNDTLDGGAGADAMAGGMGDDTYVVDLAGDTITEFAGEGTDTVLSAIDYTLGADIENLTLTGAGDLSGTGNDLDNVIIGNAGNNVLRGNGGHDSLDGGGGNDVLFGNSGNDILFGGEGDDWLLGDSGNDQLNGGSGNDQIFGGNEADIITGGAGADVMNGGGGGDTFVYQTLTDAGDTINGFSAGANGDVLDLSGLLADMGYAGSDPIGDGKVAAVQSGSKTLIMIDVGAGLDPVTLVTLNTVSEGDLTADNWIL